MINNSYENFARDTTINYTHWLIKGNNDKAEYIKRVPLFLADVIEGFMEGPVGVYKGNPIEAKTISVESIEAFKEKMLNHNYKIIFYSVTITETLPEFKVNYDENANITSCEYNGIKEPSWLIRGVWIDQNGNEVSIHEINDNKKNN